MNILLTLAQGLAGLVGGAALLATLLPLLRQSAWWIRICDFPRLQIVGGLGVALALALALPAGPLPPRAGQAFAAALALALAYQAYRIWPYTRLHRRQVQDATRPADDTDFQFSLLVANVLQYNRDASRCLGHIRHERPDVVLAVETDAWWLDQLKGIETEYPHTCHAPLPNTYGMLVFSRLPLRQAQIRYILDPEIPSFHGCVVLPGGTPVSLHFLHPKPPAPSEAPSSTRRDAELLIVGKLIEKHDGPTVVAGDLNDVAWSHTSELFRRVSRLLDPRVGRGLLPTFHADHRLLRWPLDHVFHSAHFRLRSIKRLAHIGSDHFPILMRLSYEPEGWQQQEAELEAADADDHAEAAEKIADGHESVATGEE